jgi:hypothetical protein
MTLVELLRKMVSQQISFVKDEHGRLGVTAPDGKLTPEILAALETHKEVLRKTLGLATAAVETKQGQGEATGSASLGEPLGEPADKSPKESPKPKRDRMRQAESMRPPRPRSAAVAPPVKRPSSVTSTSTPQQADEGKAINDEVQESLRRAKVKAERRRAQTNDDNDSSKASGSAS